MHWYIHHPTAVMQAQAVKHTLAMAYTETYVMITVHVQVPAEIG